MSNNQDISRQYKELVGRFPDGRWSDARIQQEIDAILEERAAQAEREAKRKADAEAEVARREAIKAARGTAAEYVERADDRFGNLRWMMRGVVHTVEGFEKVKADFIEKVQKDPSYALSWSVGFFEATAKFDVCKSIMYMFDEMGLEEEEIKKEIMERALQKNRYRASSSSPSSNLMDQCEGAAWAFFASEYR